MSVIWLMPAQDQLQASLQERGAHEGGLPRLLSTIDQTLQDTFPDADHIVVINRLAGYVDESQTQVLRVEYIVAGRSHARVVKIGLPSKLQEELDGWQSAELTSDDRGIVFMGLQHGPVTDSGPLSLVYEDAHRTFRASDVVSLERAVLDCCRWGTPSVQSLLSVLDQVFAELSVRLYRRSWSQIADADVCKQLSERLAQGLEVWNNPTTTAAKCRMVVQQSLYGNAIPFMDVVSHADQLLSPAHAPELRQGCSHGDLNGRNVVVGLVDGEARYPAVFDYEDMRRDNILGWDLVKLESELKVRAYQSVFFGDDQSFVDEVLRFEAQVSEKSAILDDLPFDQWNDQSDHTSPRDRLLAILLGIRRQAKKCLEKIHGVSRTWLQEYCFLLACYGVYSGKFSTYRRRELLVAYASAGQAAGRFANLRSTFVIPEQVALESAKQAINEGNPSFRLRKGLPLLSHHPEFIFAKTYIRSRKQGFIRNGIEILTELAKRHPLSVDIPQEAALAQIELHSLTNSESALHTAELILMELESKSPAAHFETLCRWGRYWKDRGDEHFDEQRPAEEHYKRSLDYYRRAESLAGDGQQYYPGINVATLLWLLGQRSESRKLAENVSAELNSRPRGPTEETVWILATLAESNLLLGNCADATKWYQRAVVHPRCEPHHRHAITQQMRRIMSKEPRYEGLYANLLPDDKLTIANKSRTTA